MDNARGLSLTAFAATFVPFGLGLVAATLVPEAAQDILHRRVTYSSWVSLVFFVPALSLYVVPGRTGTQRGFWLLCWSFSYLGYLVHFLWSVGGVYGWSVVEVYRGQGALIATSNFLVTAVWTADVAHAWLQARRGGDWRGKLRTVVHLLVLAIFFASSLILFSGPVRGLGVVMVVALVVSLLARYNAHKLAARR